MVPEFVQCCSVFSRQQEPEGKGGHSPFMHMQQQQPQRPPYMSGPPTMTPGEADNILAMHSMSGSGLSAPEPPTWLVLCWVCAGGLPPPPFIQYLLGGRIRI